MWSSDGPLRALGAVVRSFGVSTIDPDSCCGPARPGWTSVSDVDWHEREQPLKVAFPLDLRADDARYEVQYGHVRRPTHRNTSWDAARFEVCGHIWADVAEPGFGVAAAERLPSTATTASATPPARRCA